MAVCACKKTMVALPGRLKNGRVEGGVVYACPACDGPDKPVQDGAKSIIDISKENHGEQPS